MSHMEHFNDVFPIVLDLECVNCVASYGGKALGFSQKYLHLCSGDKLRTYGCRMI